MRTLIRSYLSIGFGAIHPLLHLIAFYPLLLVVVVVLLFLVFGVLLADYDGFHQVWHETWWVGIADPLMFANFYRQRSTERRITAAGDPTQNAPLPPQSQRLEKPEIIAKQTELLNGSKKLTPTQLDSMEDKVKLGEFQSTLPLNARPKW